jgi:hypothetical protein
MVCVWSACNQLFSASFTGLQGLRSICIWMRFFIICLKFGSACCCQCLRDGYEQCHSFETAGVLPDRSYSSQNEETVCVIPYWLACWCVFEIRCTVEICLVNQLLIIAKWRHWICTDLTNPAWYASCVSWQIIHLYNFVHSSMKVTLVAQVLNNADSRSQHPGVYR